MKNRLSSLLSLWLLAACLTGCASLPPLTGRSTSAAPTDTGETRLGQVIAPGVAAHPGLSGVHPLRDAEEAFAARVWLARTAERTLDVQYYIWHQDTSGTLLFQALIEAANRGVRVRLLLDDNGTAGLDATLAALDANPHIEVRLFNPFVQRRARVLGYLTDFSRLNRRMHNKSFTADNQATIVGGRNVGDEYFGATDGVAFADLDVLAVGPAAADVSTDFDRYWASDSAYPLRLLVPSADAAQTAQFDATARAGEHDTAATAYLKAVRDTPFVQQLLARQLAFEWVPAHLVSDDPAKGLGRESEAGLLPNKLRRIIGEPRSELQLVSPYFVPGAEGTDAFVALAQRGVKVSILTNSLAATDVAAVHSGYAKRRVPLLEGGVSLYEMRRAASAPPARTGRRALFQSSGSSLHAKVFSVDRSNVFVGSFNFDPRSINLNTEMGLVIDSPLIARGLAETFDTGMPAIAYQVLLDEDGSHLHWLEQRDGQTVRYDTEPATTFWQRAAVWLMSLLPIEWLL